MSSWPRVAVMGGSIGGLTAALLLRDLGCEVDVYERVDATLSGRGAGIVEHPQTTRYLVGAGHADIDELTTSADWWRYLTPTGETLYEEPCRHRFTAWNTIYRALRAQLDDDRYHLAVEVRDFRSGRDGVEVSLGDGREDRVDLLVAADGASSTARGLLLPAVQPRYAGYVGWRGMVREADLSPAALDAIGNAITYVVTEGSHALVYPIPGQDGGLGREERLMNFVWYRNLPEAELGPLLLGKDGIARPLSVPQGLVQDAFTRELRDAATQMLPPAVSEVIVRTAEPFVQVVVDVEVPRMAFGRVCLIGDAAFVARPHAAVGTAKACVDAWALAESLRAESGAVGRALARWEPEQLRLGTSLIERTVRIGTAYQGSGGFDPADPSLRFGFGREDLDRPRETTSVG